MPEPVKPKAIIFDVDGTLCDVRSIRHHVIPDHPDNATGKKDFKTFHELAIDCPAHPEVVEAAINAHAEGIKVLVLTARREQYRNSTRWWLIENGVTATQQLHRGNKDGRKDVEVKRDMLKLLREHYDIIEAWDDNPAIIELWRSEGIPVRVVPGWHDVAQPSRAAA